MTVTTLTTSDLAFLETLPADVRAEAEAWRDALLEVTKPITRSLERIATRLGVSYKTARRKYDDFRKGGYSVRALVNRAKLPQANSALTPEFLNYIKGLAEDNVRKTAPAWRKFCLAWSRGEQIPGLDNSLPRYVLPPGTGYDNVQKKIRDVFATTAMRRGLGAAIAKCGPQIFSDRSKLWYLSHLMLDDLWHDNFVLFRGQIVRVLELDALDVFSGCLLGFGTKPRIKREDGKMDNLKEKYVIPLLARIFFQEGYSPRGTMMMAEHGTAAVPERVRKVLYDRSGGLINLRESGITEEEQAILGWYGRGKGNPRFKAPLETIRSLKHNELADGRLIPGQTGKDVDHRPEFLHGQLQDCEETIKVMATLARENPERAAMLKFNLLDYHAHFLPLLMDVYQLINRRGEFPWWSHELQGWYEAGHVMVQYRTTPTSEHWLTEGEFSQLPEVSRQLLLTAAQEDKRFINTRKLSPAEVSARHRGSLIKLRPFVVGELLGEDYARELEVRGAYFKPFEDAELAPPGVELRYESVIVTPDGQREQLSDGKYMVVVNPFDTRYLFVHDARMRCLGIAPRVERVNPNDLDQLRHAFGYRKQRLAELQAPILARHAGRVREEAARLAHNARVLDTSKPLTDSEKAAAAQSRSIAAYTGSTAELAEPAAATEAEPGPDDNFSAEALL